MKRIILSAIMVLALAAGSASAEVVWSEGFNDGWSTDIFSSTAPPFFNGYGANDGAVATPSDEGDGHAWMNDTSADISGVSTFSYGEVTLGEVVAAGDTYTFTGNFTIAGWLTGGSDYAIDETNTGSNTAFFSGQTKLFFIHFF